MLSKHRIFKVVSIVKEWMILSIQSYTKSTKNRGWITLSVVYDALCYPALHINNRWSIIASFSVCGMIFSELFKINHIIWEHWFKVIHDHHFSHLLVYMEKMNFCGALCSRSIFVRENIEAHTAPYSGEKLLQNYSCPT